MEINYIILAHENPDQLKSLVSTLAAPWVNFYIHIDKNKDLQVFQNYIEDEKVFFLNDKERKPGIWGDIGIVQGTVNILKKIVRDNRTGYCILLSGQDFPLRSNNLIRDFFRQNDGVNFIDFYDNPSTWAEKADERLNHYKINRSEKRGDFFLLPYILHKKFYTRSTLSNLYYLFRNKRFLALSLIFKKRKFPNNISPYCGSVYWALPIDSIKKILQFLKSDTDYLKYHTHTICADEIFFHSILLSVIRPEKHLVKKSLTYVNWNKISASFPVTFSIQDFKELEEASKDFLFARKFDSNYDKEILKKINSSLLKS